MSVWELRRQVRRRLGEEAGTLWKEAGLRVALCYPSPYPVGMSSLGFQTIYREIHAHPGAAAERVFLPDSIRHYRDTRAPLFSYEGERPLGDFQVIAFSISYELEITGLFEMLDLCGVPLLRELRADRHPLVIAGGPLTNSNPLPVAPFVDLVVLGEAEELIHELLEAAATMPRSALLDHFAQARGCYVPGLTAAIPSIAKADDRLLPARSQIITRDAVLSSMFLIEPERGCSRGCTYCVMRRTTNGGMRLVPPELVLSLIPDDAKRVGLVGAAVTDHPKIKDVVRRIVESGREVGISSLRADRLDGELVGLLARGGYRTLTTASDGASQRLRDLVDRRTNEAHLLRVAELARQFRLQRLKLYQLLGLPGETSEDLEELVRFSRELGQVIPLSLAISPFVAKRNTPLDNCGFEPVSSLERKLARLRADLKGKVEMRSTSARWAWVEYMLAQGDERAGLAAMDAWRAGGAFAAWQRAFSEREVTLPKPGILSTLLMLVTLVLMLAGTAVSPAADKKTAAEGGDYVILVDGKEIGSEKFTIQSAAGSCVSTSILEFRNPSAARQKVRLETRLEMNDSYVPRAYLLKSDVDGSRGTMSGAFAPNQAIFEYVSGGKPQKRGLLVGDRYTILDSNIYHHFIFLARLFDFGSAERTQKFEVLIPQEMDSGTLKITQLRRDRLVLGGKKRDVRVLQADSGALQIELMVDNNGVLQKISVPARALEVLRR